MLKDWDIFSVGYATKLVPDIVGIWKANAPIDPLAGMFYTAAMYDQLGAYKSLVIISHSMGGLVTQRALVDHDDLAVRVSHVFLFGTPSAGLKKAGPFGFRSGKRGIWARILSSSRTCENGGQKRSTTIRRFGSGRWQGTRTSLFHQTLL